MRKTTKSMEYIRTDSTFPQRVIGGETIECAIACTGDCAASCEAVFRAVGMTDVLARVPAVRTENAWKFAVSTSGWAPANNLVFWEIWERFSGGYMTLRERGSFTFTLSAGTAGAAFDPRSVAEKTVAMLEKALSGSADPTVKSYQINNRRIDRYSATELLDLLQYWRKRVASEKAAERGAPQDVKFFL
ncbi:MAG: hypothetical protein IJW12_05090 [Opitutales bacterium]|nr:hypothetical protein [Opitutales bacterium]